MLVKYEVSQDFYEKIKQYKLNTNKSGFLFKFCGINDPEENIAYQCNLMIVPIQKEKGK